MSCLPTHFGIKNELVHEMTSLFQGWLSASRRWLLLDDELDEMVFEP